MRYIEDIQQIHIELTRDDGDILVVCSLLDKLCFLMVDWVCARASQGRISSRDAVVRRQRLYGQTCRAYSLEKLDERTNERCLFVHFRRDNHSTLKTFK